MLFHEFDQLDDLFLAPKVTLLFDVNLGACCSQELLVSINLAFPHLEADNVDFIFALLRRKTIANFLSNHIPVPFVHFRQLD